MLHQYTKAAARTEFGRAHDLSGVRNHEDFVRRVPLRTYAEFEPYLERMRHGERNVLWPGLIKYWGQSSGSSNTAAQHKFLPISRRQIRWQQQAGFDVTARYVTASGDASLLGGFPLALLPPSTLKPDGPVFITNNPGLMQRFIPPPISYATLPRPPLRDIPDYEQKLTAVAQAYLDYDIRFVTGTTCWFSIFFDKVLEAAQDRGQRVRTISEVWPNLKVLFGGGIYVEPYRRVIAERMGRPLVLMDNYNATEGGIFSATDRLGQDGMIMIPDRGVFFEFVPKEEHGKPNARRFPLWAVEPGVEYSVVLTTSSGLAGYYIGDSIRFSSLFPHRMEFTGRMTGMLSLTQELTSHLEIERAVAKATSGQDCTVVDFSAAAQVGVEQTGKGRYLLFVEFEKPPRDLQAFTEAFDKGLCEQNRVYREHRSSNVAILPPALVPLVPGGTRKFMQALGHTSMQQKFPRILDERKRDLLLSFTEVRREV
jgi:hypothetical protein